MDDYAISKGGNSVLIKKANTRVIEKVYAKLDKNTDTSDPFIETADKTTSFANTIDSDDPFAETAGNISDPFNEVAAVLTEQEKTLQSNHNTQVNLNQDSLNLSMK